MFVMYFMNILEREKTINILNGEKNALSLWAAVNLLN